MATAPRVTIAKPNRQSGVLSLPVAATQKKAGSNAEGKQSAASTRLKLVVRRLPPGLTCDEFEKALGSEWKAGGGKVSWLSFKAGKISKDPGRPSRPGRAYVNITHADLAALFSDKIRGTSFVEAKGTSKDGSLLGPPSVEIDPYTRIPSGRNRKDAREGTIDQDPEFKDFLESLTNPPPKAAQTEQDPKDKAVMTTTPLIQFLREKKANKSKETAGSKGGRSSRHEKERKASGKKTTVQTVSAQKKRGAQTAKVEQVTKEAVKVLNKQAANLKEKSQGGPAENTQNATQDVAPSAAARSALAGKQRERGNMSAAAKILQRDLGLGAKNKGKEKKQANSTVSRPSPNPPANAKKRPNGESATATPPATTKPTAGTDANNSSRNTAKKGGPTENRSDEAQTVNQATPKGGRGGKTQPSKGDAPTSTTTGTQAFLKHANPSQGITEELLEQVFKEHGSIKSVEIDRKRGFAYVEFEQPSGLQKAIEASPVKVAQGQVQVLERKTGAALQARNQPHHQPGARLPKGATGDKVASKQTVNASTEKSAITSTDTQGKPHGSQDTVTNQATPAPGSSDHRGRAGGGRRHSSKGRGGRGGAGPHAGRGNKSETAPTGAASSIPTEQSGG